MSNTAQARKPSMRADVTLDWKYRARRTGQTPAEYASAVERHVAPRKSWLAYIVTAALLVGAYLIARS